MAWNVRFALWVAPIWGKIAPVIALDLGADATWLSLIQGTVGSVVALAGAVFVVLLTIQHERRKDRRRELLDQADRVSDRTANAIADIATAAAYVVRDVRHAPFFRINASTDLLAATLRFVLVVNANHPVVADWALAQNQMLNDQMAKYRGRWLLPLGRRRRQEAWSRPLGQLGGRLVLWHTGQIDDDWFAADLMRLRGNTPTELESPA